MNKMLRLTGRFRRHGLVLENFVLSSKARLGRTSSCRVKLALGELRPVEQSSPWENFVLHM